MADPARRRALDALGAPPGDRGLAADVAHPAGPLHLVTSCLAWEPDAAAQRHGQFEALVHLLTARSRDGPLPVVLTGDLNTPPGRELAALTDVMAHAWTAAGDAHAGRTLSSSNPFVAAGASPHLVDQRIDYVMARPGTPQRPVVVERAFLAGTSNEMPPSDHYSVVADFRV